ncbi:16S rRNA (uracil(1498)-N(3))-methyltransferase [Pseudomaricurvus alcaniphilus]|uniref:16S rRNA (uracil(1498)-N(3))-methyltransferase n=1 Tax=Pseudomaricurvus alcaniphilus TaxID=1166482 RepID=UPI00140737C7|nr:16S rRNA (uracil(1498)-N(3))-methyltransferase [Pseudomaricurvus alcaniphilus]NHN37655.1 16S rRNA (uracil(1498)-N(3))-methyltransferase [Pseudomaricurvus alcaniphilus]
MNLLLLEDSDFTAANRVTLRGRRLQHILEVHQLASGASVRAGRLNGAIGSALVEHISGSEAQLRVDLTREPPPPLPLTLIVALPRPKMIKRIVQTIATMGVKKLVFLNSYRVEKSYWQSPLLEPEKLHQQLLLGLEQGVDTLLPDIRLVKRFKPFVEDELPQLCAGKRALVAHPRAASTCPEPLAQETVLVIGPEGGFIDYEIDKLIQAGCQSVHLGPRILRVETAVPVLLGKLFPITGW